MFIALGHRRFVGKDTATKILIEEFAKRGIHAVRASFADKLKEECARLFGWAGLRGPQYYEDRTKLKEVVLPALGKSPRTIWIEVGNALREVYPRIWIDLALKETRRPGQITIISDLRYPNEVVSIREAGGALIKITRKIAPVCDDPADSALADFDDWDYVISNDEGRDAFRTSLGPLIGIGEAFHADAEIEE